MTGTLMAARETLIENLDAGAICPCCEKYVRRYRRRFNSSMARALCWLVRESPKGEAWIDVPNFAPDWLTRTNQLPTVRWWSLIERGRDDDPKTKHSGRWRPTQRGIDFVRNGGTIPSTVVTYNGQVFGYEGSPVTIHDTLGVKFDYSAIMRGEG